MKSTSKTNNPDSPAARLASVDARLTSDQTRLTELEADLTARLTAQADALRAEVLGGTQYPPERREENEAAIRAAERSCQQLRNSLDVLTDLRREVAEEAFRADYDAALAALVAFVETEGAKVQKIVERALGAVREAGKATREASETYRGLCDRLAVPAIALGLIATRWDVGHIIPVPAGDLPPVCLRSALEERIRLALDGHPDTVPALPLARSAGAVETANEPDPVKLANARGLQSNGQAIYAGQTHFSVGRRED